MSSISQEQPVMAYPNTFTQQQQQPNPSSSHSNGSFGSVFIVLAVIIVISAVACFLGRLCSRKSHKGHTQKPKASHKQAQAQSQSQSKIQPESQKFRIRPKEEDIELGFDFEKMRTAKGGGVEFGFDKKRSGREAGIEFAFDKRAPSARPAGGNGGPRGFVKPSENGGVNKFAGEPRATGFGPQ